ncbi:hypothetical protein ACFL2Q_05760 [Thermodesulfobacteriota bacterium]
MKTLNGQEVAFMGKVTANMTHELSNVFAAIKENAALMEDILTLSEDVSPRNQAWIPEKIAKIRELVRRGVDLTATLNTFAHTPDKSLAQVDVKEVVELVVSLTRRLAAFKGIFLEISPKARPVPLTTNPLRIQMVLFDCVELFTEVAGRQGAVLIKTWTGQDEEAMVDFTFEEKEPDGQGWRVIPTSSPRWPVLEENVKNLNGRIHLGEPPTWFALGFRTDLRQAAPVAVDGL